MRILASPARRNRARNPYNYLLSEALAAEGCEVVDLDDRNGLTSGFDVFHIHWPQEAARGRLFRALRKTIVLATLLAVQRVRGTRIVWTVHNVRGHDQNNAGLERILLWLVARAVTGVLFLTDSSRAAALEGIPRLASKPCAVIPHGLYGRTSGKTRAEARVQFSLPSDGPVIGFLGDIKRYKGLDRVLGALEGTPPGRVTLFIAGEIPSRSYGIAIRDQLSRLTAKGHSISFREQRLNDQELVDAVRACDLIALPYRAIWNSGLALLVLENKRRVLASDAPVFRELQAELGTSWIWTFGEELTGEALLAAASALPNEAVDPVEVLARSRSWSRIGAETVAFYRRLGAR